MKQIKVEVRGGERACKETSVGNLEENGVKGSSRTGRII